LANSQATTLASFATSPLITPDRLRREDLDEVFGPAPPWAVACTPAYPEPLPPDEAKMEVQLGGRYPGGYSLPTASLAILFELTRYGNTVLVDADRKPSLKGALYYLTFKPSASAKDTISVSRILGGLGKHQRARTPKDTPHDLTPENWSVEGGGSPSKDARAISMRYAEERARHHGRTAPEVEAYLVNLRALFTYHDEVLRLQPV
jgi:hypothetical protein